MIQIITNETGKGKFLHQMPFYNYKKSFSLDKFLKILKQLLNIILKSRTYLEISINIKLIFMNNSYILKQTCKHHRLTYLDVASHTQWPVLVSEKYPLNNARVHSRLPPELYL